MIHKPVLLAEAIAALAVKPHGTYVDGTFGRGGHTRAILAQLGSGGRVVAFDRDEDAVAVGATFDDPRFELHHAAFSEAADLLGDRKVDGVLLDIGVSSPQLEDSLRGFSFRRDGPLDMRMDRSKGPTAAEWLRTVEEKKLREVIRDYGEERYAKQVAKAIVDARSGQPIVTTGQLAEVVASAVRRREPGQDPATRTFQAIRIVVNRELEELALALPRLFDALAPGGRLVVISFHSLEDRIVKRFMAERALGPAVHPDLPLRQDELPRPEARLVGRAVRAGVEEIAANPRARSAIMRTLEKLPS